MLLQMQSKERVLREDENVMERVRRRRRRMERSKDEEEGERR